MSSLISPDQHFLIWTVIISVSIFGMISEKRRWFGNLAGVLVTIITMAVLATMGVVPSASDATIQVPTYTVVTTYLLPMAIPLLLFNADIRKIIRESGRLLTAYLLGSAGIVLGALAAFYMINLGEEGFKVVAVFIATLIGGSVNFMAAAETFEFTKSNMFAASIAVDNFIVSVFVFLLFLIPSLKWLTRYFPGYSDEIQSPIKINKESNKHQPLDMLNITVVLGISALICTLGNWCGPLIEQWSGLNINFNILVITALTLIIANVFPKQLKKFEVAAFELGMMMMYLFLAVIGAATNPKDILIEGPAILLFCLLTLIIHLTFLLITSRYFKISLKELAVASAANVGGPTIAAPMAATFGAKKMITPGILVGILGYVIGTALGVTVGLWVS